MKTERIDVMSVLTILIHHSNTLTNQEKNKGDCIQIFNAECLCFKNYEILVESVIQNTNINIMQNDAL